MTDLPTPTTRWHALVDRFSAFLERPALPVYAALLSALLALPSLWLGLQFDDFGQRLVTLHPESLPSLDSPNELFTLVKSDPRKVEALVESGVVPWWTNPHLRLSFWRPLSSLVHRLEYSLWPNQPVPLHGIMILLLMLLTWLAGVLYRELLGPTWMAGLATLLFAVDDGHASAVGWIACHNTFLVAIFGLATVYAHLLSVKGTRPGARGWALLAWILALASNEGAVAVLGFLLAYEVFLAAGSPGRGSGFTRLLPYLLILLVWSGLRQHLGHGVQGCGFYADPLTEPVSFLRQALIHAPVLLFGQWGFPSPNFFCLLSKPWTSVWLVVSLLGITTLALSMRREIRQFPEARFFGAAMLLALLPVSATIPADRLLFFVGFAAFGLMAMFLSNCRAAWTDGPKPYGTLWRAGLGLGLLLLHGPMNAVSFPVATTGMATFARLAVSPFDEVMRTPAGEGTRFLIVNGPSAFFTAYAGGAASFQGFNLPRCLHLAPGIYPLELERPDERTLVIRPQGGFLQEPGTWNQGKAPLHLHYLIQYFDLVYRSRSVRFTPEDTISLSDVQVQIRKVDDAGMPAEVVFRFAKPLEDASLKWFAWKDRSLRPFVLPAPGSSLHLPGIELSLFDI